jgi:hypothetical protein
MARAARGNGIFERSMVQSAKDRTRKNISEPLEAQNASFPSEM